jgi:hypothetical protein
MPPAPTPRPPCHSPHPIFPSTLCLAGNGWQRIKVRLASSTYSIRLHTPVCVTLVPLSGNKWQRIKVRLASWGSLDFVPFVHSVHFARELQAYPPCTSDFCRHCALLFQLWCVLKEVGAARRSGALLREKKKRVSRG